MCPSRVRTRSHGSRQYGLVLAERRAAMSSSGTPRGRGHRKAPLPGVSLGLQRREVRTGGGVGLAEAVLPSQLETRLCATSHSTSHTRRAKADDRQLRVLARGIRWSFDATRPSFRGRPVEPDILSPEIRAVLDRPAPSPRVRFRPEMHRALEGSWPHLSVASPRASPPSRSAADRESHGVASGGDSTNPSGRGAMDLES